MPKKVWKTSASSPDEGGHVLAVERLSLSVGRATWFIRNATIISILAAKDEAPESIAVDPRLTAQDAQA